jgi:predicted DsbA family dithiol-disulfide isomerase
MFHAHFGSARNLWTPDQVLDFAAEVGLDREETAQVLHERRYQAQVAADQREVERLGAHGTPFITLDATYAIPGAVGTDELLAAMTTAWKAARPEPQPMRILGEVGGASAQDGCIVAPRHRTP